MSRIRRLAIRGIRNFGPEGEEAEIRFYRPLTLILGPNGTGKTTIIEALKFATTGEFPPDSDKGKAFVHDPVFGRQRAVKCSVKAEIIDADGNSIVVCRIMDCTKHGKKTQLHTLDTSITRKNKGSTESVTVNNRCIDADKEISVIMGVSKPIFKYVIFCHQEDFNWPFESGKPLKEKFDEIFDNVKTNKYLENITKCMKQLQAKLTIAKNDAKHYEILVNEVKKKEEKLKDQRKRLDNSRNMILEICHKLAPIRTEMDELEVQEHTYRTAVSKSEMKRMELKLAKQERKRLKDSIKNVFKGSVEDLKTEISLYDSTLKTKTHTLIKLKEQLQNNLTEESKKKVVLADAKIRIATLIEQRNEHERKIKFRDQVLNKALSAWNLDTFESKISDTELNVIKQRLSKKIKLEQEQMIANRVKREQEERNLQDEVDNARTENSKVESEKNLKEQELVEIQVKYDAMETKLKEIEEATNKLNTIEAELKTAKDQITHLNNTLDVDVIKKQIEEKTEKRNEIDSLLNTVDTEITILHKQISIQNELDFNKTALSEKQQEFDKIKTKLQNNLKLLLNTEEIPEKKLKFDIDMIHKKLANQIKSIESDIQKKASELTALETTIKINEKELEKKQKEIDVDKERVSTISDYKKFDEILALQSVKVKDLQDKKGLYTYKQAAYREYMKQLKQAMPCCPLCHRDFSKSDNVQQLLDDMEKEMKDHPQRLKQLETDLKVEQERYDRMLQLRPVVENILNFEDTELAELQNALQESAKEATQCRLSITELTSKKQEPESKLSKIKEITGDIILWDRCIDELLKLQNIIGNITTRLASTGVETSRTIEEAQAEKRKLKDVLKNISSEIEKLKLELNEHNGKLQDIREFYNILHEKQLKIQSAMQKENQLKEEQKANVAKQYSLKESINKLQKKLSETAIELRVKIERLETKKKNNNGDTEQERVAITNGQNQLAEFEKAQNDVMVFESRKIPESIQQLESTIENHDQLLNELAIKKLDLEKSINDLKEDLNNQEFRKRELNDNMLLKKAEEKVSSVSEEAERLIQQINGVDIERIANQRQELKEQEKKLLDQKNKIQGNQEELQRDIKDVTNELSQDLYRDARKKLKQKYIESMVQEESISSLKIYSQVLDSAMIKFHQERLETVNKIIKQLWKHVYTGSDTTSIEIRAEPTEGVGAQRRSYNYKLIQLKHGREIDMRGRCSAGQKVLASIIIRLALAETFCSNSGLLALDEPTTNLDEENANSLATALSQVVRLRSQRQKNFQLIVISHDEKFLSKLATFNSHGGYYELYRKPNGLTAIKSIEAGRLAVSNVEENTQSTNSNTTAISSDDENEVSAELHTLGKPTVKSVTKLSTSMMIKAKPTSTKVPTKISSKRTASDTLLPFVSVNDAKTKKRTTSEKDDDVETKYVKTKKQKFQLQLNYD